VFESEDRQEFCGLEKLIICQREAIQGDEFNGIAIGLSKYESVIN
jgi:hypothetical protein